MLQLVLVGGFLGSGKTTAIVNACQELIGRDKKVAVITNDQGDQQVDAAFVKSLGITTREIGNGCFCCRYDELDRHLLALQTLEHPDVIFAESVGSCTDLVATIVKPLGQLRPDMKTIVSVFADASQISALMEGRASFLEESVRYIFRKQMEEADFLILNKIDLLSSSQLTSVDQALQAEYPDKIILHQNSHKSDHIIQWLEALNGFHRSDRPSLSLDYDVYGEGESRLAWLDKRITIQAPQGNGGFAGRRIMQRLFEQLRHNQIAIGHLKFFIETDRWKEKVSFTTSSTEGIIKMRNEEIVLLKMLINARVQTSPSVIEKLMNNVLTEVELSEGCTIATEQEAVFKPGFPRPTHRMA